MKKILLTLIAVAAIFVACDKDGLDQEITNINVLEQAEEINASVETDIDAIDAFINRVLSNSKKYPSKSNVTGRSTTPAAGSYVRILAGEQGPVYYEFGFSDDVEVCNEADYSYLTTNVYLVYNANQDTEIRIGTLDATPIRTIDRDLRQLFSIAINEGISYNFGTDVLDFASTNSDGALVIGSQAFDFVCAGWMFDSATMTWSHPTYGSYVVSPAPFPLSGLLATVETELGTYTSAHYAASGSMTDASNAGHALNTRIQADFDGTND